MTQNTVSALKGRADRLKRALKGYGYDVKHSHALESVAQEEGFRDWNTASALLPLALDEVELFPAQLNSRVSGSIRGNAFTGRVVALKLRAKKGLVKVTVEAEAPINTVEGPRLSAMRRRFDVTVDATGHSTNLAGKSDGVACLRIS